MPPPVLFFLAACFILYPFGTRSQIDRRKDCPKGTTCVAENTDLVSFDTCNNVMRCISIGH